MLHARIVIKPNGGQNQYLRQECTAYMTKLLQHPKFYVIKMTV